jgi:hypothetical protein
MQICNAVNADIAANYLVFAIARSVTSHRQKTRKIYPKRDDDGVQFIEDSFDVRRLTLSGSQTETRIGVIGFCDPKRFQGCRF